MSAHLTDQALALLQISNSVAKLVTQLNQLSLATSLAHKTLMDVGDLGHKITNFSFTLEALLGHARGFAGALSTGAPTGSTGGLPGPAAGMLPPWQQGAQPAERARQEVEQRQQQLGQQPVRVDVDVTNPSGRQGTPNAGGSLPTYPGDPRGSSSNRRTIIPGLLPFPGRSDIYTNQHYDLNPSAQTGLANSNFDRRPLSRAPANTAAQLSRGANYARNREEEAQAGRNLGQFNNQLRASRQPLLGFADGLGELTMMFTKKTLLAGLAVLDSASPDLMSTLMGSFKLLAAVVGETLIPTFANVAGKIQDTAHWFRELSPATKNLVARFMGYALGAAAVVGVARASGVAQVATTLGPAALAGARAHPYISAGLAAGAAAVGTYAYLRGQTEDPEDHRLALSREKLHSDPTFQFFKTFGNQEELKANLDREEAVTRKRANRSSLYSAAYAATPIVGPIMALESFFGTSDAAKKLNTLEATRKDLLGGGYSGPQQKQALLQAHGLLLDFQSRSQPSYSSVEDVYKQIQLKALGDSPLQEEIRKIQLQALEELVKIAGNTAAMNEYKSVAATFGHTS